MRLTFLVVQLSIWSRGACYLRRHRSGKSASYNILGVYQVYKYWLSENNVPLLGSWCYGEVPSLPSNILQDVLWREPDAWQSILWRRSQKALLSLWAAGFVCFHRNSKSWESNTIEPDCINASWVFAVPLRGVLCVYEVERAGNQEPDVDIRMCCTEPEVEDPRQCRLHVLSQVRSEKHIKLENKKKEHVWSLLVTIFNPPIYQRNLLYNLHFFYIYCLPKPEPLRFVCFGHTLIGSLLPIKFL